MVSPTSETQGENSLQGAPPCRRCFSLFFPPPSTPFCAHQEPTAQEHRQEQSQTIMGHLHSLGWIRVHVLSLMQQLWVIIDGFHPDNTIG